MIAITDRPVYRPGQPVRFKFWVGHARYDQPDASDFARKTFTVEIQNPKGEKVLTKNFEADDFGGFDGSIELPSDAALGVYQLYVTNMGGGSFRVEEYKKPEFEVNVEAPTKPVMLGEKVPATIKAKYYFGSPVAEAKVKYKITRTAADERWYPDGPVGLAVRAGLLVVRRRTTRGIPAGRGGACLRPVALVVGPAPGASRGRGRGRGADPARRHVRRRDRHRPGEAGHPDEDHRYEITAEVTDQSRRTIVGDGHGAGGPQAVHGLHLARSRPLPHRRHHRGLGPGPDARPQAGRRQGHAQAPEDQLRRRSQARRDARRELGACADADGQAGQTIKAGSAGQYRLSATVDDGQGHTIEGGYLFTILGQGFDGASFRFNDLEIIPDRKEYRPGEKLGLLINTNQVNATVLLFVRPINSVYLAPRVVHLTARARSRRSRIVARDMPNFFVEALTVAGGKVHAEGREIAVPPESRVVNVAVEPSQPTYKPGQKAKVKLKLTGPDGKPSPARRC